MQFLRTLDTNVDDAYAYITTILNDSIRFSEQNELVFNFRLNNYIDIEDLFLSIITNYKYAGYKIHILEHGKSQYSINLYWGDQIRPVDEYDQLMWYIHTHDIDYKTLQTTKKLRRISSQLSTFPKYKNSASILNYVYDYVKTCINSIMRFVWISY